MRQTRYPFTFSRALGAVLLSIILLNASWGEGPDEGEDVTVVTSERLTYDASKHYALFEENVVVTDPQLQMTCDRLTLFFDEAGEAKSIRAVGNVEINTEDKRSSSGVATYDVASGKIVLTENPSVTQGSDTIQADTITFWRDDNKMTSTGRVRVIVSPQEGGARKQVFGE